MHDKQISNPDDDIESQKMKKCKQTLHLIQKRVKNWTNLRVTQQCLFLPANLLSWAESRLIGPKDIYHVITALQSVADYKLLWSILCPSGVQMGKIEKTKNTITSHDVFNWRKRNFDFIFLQTTPEFCHHTVLSTKLPNVNHKSISCQMIYQ